MRAKYPSEHFEDLVNRPRGDIGTWIADVDGQSPQVIRASRLVEGGSV